MQAALPQRLTRQSSLAASALLAALLAACGGTAPQQHERARSAALQRDREAWDLCQRSRAVLPERLAAWRQARRALASVEAETYAATAPPKPLDPEEQRRLAIYDQELEQEQYNQALERWRQQEQPRRAAWQQAWSQRRAAAQADLTRASEALRRISPALLATGVSAEPNSKQLARLQVCLREPRP